MRYVAPAIVVVAAFMMALAVLTTQRPSVIMMPVSSAVASHAQNPEKSVHGLKRLHVLPTYALDIVITPTQREVIVNQPHSAMTIARGETVDLAGWAVDGAAMRPARAVLIDLDGTYVPTLYGDERPDVAKVLGDESLKQVGYKVRLPPLSPGVHKVGIIIVNSAGTGYYEAPERLRLTAKP